MSRRLVLATGNPHKVRELAAIVARAGLPLSVCAAKSLGPAPSVVEDQGSFVAHALLKARSIAGWLQECGEPGRTLVLADDSGLCVDALGGLPGVDSAYFAGPEGDDAANNRRLVAEFTARGLSSSPAHYVCVLALRRVDGARLPDLPGSSEVDEVRLLEARWHGEVRTAARGTGGFGYDRHFWPEGSERSAAELSAVEKDAASHRGQATARLLAALPAVLADGGR